MLNFYSIHIFRWLKTKHAYEHIHLCFRNIAKMQETTKYQFKRINTFKSYTTNNMLILITRLDANKRVTIYLRGVQCIHSVMSTDSIISVVSK